MISVLRGALAGPLWLPSKAGTAPQIAVWQDFVNSSAVGGILTATAYGGNAGSAQQIVPGGYFEFTLAADTFQFLVGPSVGANHMAGILFGTYFYFDGGSGRPILHYESGVFVGGYSYNWNPGDVIRIATDGATCKVYQNGSLIFTHSGNITGPAHLGALCYSSGNKLYSPLIGGPFAG